MTVSSDDQNPARNLRATFIGYANLIYEELCRGGVSDERIEFKREILLEYLKSAAIRSVHPADALGVDKNEYNRVMGL